MKETLADIKSKLQSGVYTNEEHVRLSLVARILQRLDWNIWDPREVNSEFVVVPHEDKTRVDLAVFLTPNLPSVFIEIKPVGHLRVRLPEIERQVRDYNRNNTSLFSLITDGREWRFYYSQTAGEFAQKLFATFDLLKDNLEDVEHKLLIFLKKSEVANGSAGREAESYLRLTQKQRAMEDCLAEARRLLNEPPFQTLPEALLALVRARGCSVAVEDAQEFIKQVAGRKPLTPAPIQRKQLAVKSPDRSCLKGGQQERLELSSDSPMCDQTDLVASIGSSRWSRAQRQALLMVYSGKADQTEHFVPHPWNRRAKALAGLRELERAGHISRVGGRFVIVESSFSPAHTEAGVEEKPD